MPKPPPLTCPFFVLGSRTGFFLGAAEGGAILTTHNVHQAWRTASLREAVEVARYAKGFVLLQALTLGEVACE